VESVGPQDAGDVIDFFGSGQFRSSTDRVLFRSAGQPEVEIGTYTGSLTSYAPLVVQFNDQATTARVQALLRSIRYGTTAAGPATGDRLFRFALTDGDGGASSPVLKTVQLDLDDDGILDRVEDLGDPDRNNDGVPDRRQAHVAAFPNGVTGQYVVVTTGSDAQLQNVQAVNNPSPSNAPANATFPVGFFEFLINGLTPGALVRPGAAERADDR
jgi:hypothetical protein